MQGKMRVQEMIEKLNMKKDLEKYWENPPIPAEETICESEEDSDEESDEDICEEDKNEGDSEGDSLSTEKTINEMIYKELNAEEESKEVEKIKASAVMVEKGATLAMTLKKYHQVHFLCTLLFPKIALKQRQEDF